MSDQASLRERLEQERQERRRNLADFDKQLVALFRELQRDPDSSLSQTAATGILEGQRGKLLYAGECSASYAQHGGIAWGRIEQLTWLDGPQRKALRALLDALAAVAYRADTSRQERENVKKLTAAVEDYGELRNLPIVGLGDGDQGGVSKPKAKRGRKPDTDPKEDKRIADAWGTGKHRTYEECAAALGGLSKKEVKEAIDRHRHRTPGKRRRRTQAPE